MFEFSIKDYHEYWLEDSKIIEVCNFFNDPEAILNRIEKAYFEFTKGRVGFNGLAYEDKRCFLKIHQPELFLWLSKITNQKSMFEDAAVTNKTLFFEKEFNDYNENFWWPHLDCGYNAIVYLNKYNGAGTNLYQSVKLNRDRLEEQYEPWNPKEDWKLLHTINSEFNKLVIFDGARFFHGMAIVDKTFFITPRLNLVFFFE